MTSRGDERRRVPSWPWAIVGIIALAAAVLGVVTSQGWRPTLDTILAPPFEVPSVAAVLPGVDELAEDLELPLVLIAAGPPQMELFTSPSTFVGEIRQASVAGGWDVEFITPSQDGWVHAAAVEANWTSFADTLPLRCNADLAAFDPGVPVKIATQNVVDGAVSLCATFVRGVTWVNLTAVFGAGDAAPDAATRAEQFAALVTTVYDRTPSAGLEPPAIVDVTGTRALILKGWFVALLVLAGMSTVVPLLLDRSTWERLTSYVVPRRRRVPAQEDLEPRRAGIAMRATALGLVKFAILVWALRLTEELGTGVWGSFGVMIAAYLLAVVVVRLIVGRGIRLLGAPQTSIAGKVVLGLGLLLTVGTIALALLLFQGAATAIASSWAPGLNVWQAVVVGNLTLWLSAAALLLAFLPLALARRLAGRLRAPKAADDGQPPVLLLRSFGDDQLRMYSRRADRRGLIDQLVLRRRERFEDVVASALARFGPVIAVGSPNEALPPELGATRLSFTNDEWQDRVAELTDSATIIAMTIGRTPGLAWETQRLRRNGLLHKTVFIVPPTGPRERRRRLAVLADALELPWSALETAGTARSVLVVCMPMGVGAPVVSVARGPDDISYETAISAAADRIHTIGLQELLEPGRPQSAPDDDLEPPPVEMLSPEAVTRANHARKAVRRMATTSTLIAVSAVLSTVVATLALSDGSLNDRRVIGLGDGVGVSAIAGVHDGRTVAASGGYVFSVAPDTDVRIIAELPDAVTAADLVDGVVYYLQFDADAVGALDVTSGEVLWESKVPHGTRALAVTEGSVTVASPATGEIIRLAAADGSELDRLAVDGIPWDVAPVSATEVAVALIGEGAVVALTVDGLTEYARIPTIASPRDIVTSDDVAFVSSSVANEIELVANDWSLWSRIRFPALAAGSGYVAIETLDAVVVVDPKRDLADQVHYPTMDGSVDAMRIEGRMLIVAQPGYLWYVELPD